MFGPGSPNNPHRDELEWGGELLLFDPEQNVFDNNAVASSESEADNESNSSSDSPARQDEDIALELDDINLELVFVPPSPRPIDGVRREFPGPMSANHSMIWESVVHNLQRAKHILIECPSEEERRISIPCGVLSYWNWKHGGGNVEPGPNIQYDLDENISPMPSKIFYVTKSAAELDSAIRYLNEVGTIPSLMANMKIAVLDKKQNLCVNEAVIGTECVDNQCLRLVQNCNTSRENCDTCPNYSAQRRETTPLIQWRLGGHHVMDIEEVKLDCRQRNHCPYYDGLQNMDEGANLIICPQEILLCPILRRDYKIDLKDAILIFDDGYNIEKCCSNEISIGITDKELRQANSCFTNAAASFNGHLSRIENAQELRDSLTTLAYSLSVLSNWMRQNIETDPAKDEILEMLRPFQQYESNPVNSAIHNLHQVEQLSARFAIPVSDTRILNKIRKFLLIISYLFRNNGAHTVDYRVFMKNSGNNVITLRLVCGNSSLVFQPIADAAASVIIASGCLAPIPSLKTELGVEFNETVEIPHLDIAVNRTYFAHCHIGPNNVDFALNYNCRNAPRILHEAGEALLNICNTVSGGVIALFHTKPVFEKMVLHWSNPDNYPAEGESLFNRLSEIKHIVSELGMINDRETTRLLGEYREAVGNPNNNQTGGVLLALHRGKLYETEELKFSGNEARTIVHIGIPFGSWYTDNYVMAKRDHLDSLEGEGVHDSPRNKEWYYREAFRIVDLSFGKICQQRGDWGAVILLDGRMQEMRFDYSLLPAWVRYSQNGFQQFRNFNEMISRLLAMVETIDAEHNEQ